MMTREIFIQTLVILILTACMSVTSSQPELRPVAVQLAWSHSAQFAGFYAAAQKGYYAEEGLVVAFIEGGPQIDRLPAVLRGQAQFGISGATELIAARALGQPVRAVAVILRRDPFAFFALAESGIVRPEDFVGRTIQVRMRARPILHAITKRVGIEPEQYTEQHEATFEGLYGGEVDVATGFITSELPAAERLGYQLNVIHPDDYGVHFYTDIIVTTDELITAEPDLIARFLRASFKGWTYAVEHPAEAGALVTPYNPEADLALENDTMLASLPLINTGEDHIGWMKPEIWAGMAETLRQQTALTTPVEIQEVYTMQFLREIYGE